MRRFLYLLSISFHLQISVTIGLGFSFLVGTYYYLKTGTEDLLPISLALLVSGLFSLLGLFLHKKFDSEMKIGFKDSVVIVVLTWLIASGITAIAFFLAGFPERFNESSYTLIRRLVDSYFEAMSGYTTTGASILVNIENLPKSILMLRVITHWIGGMGIAYMTITAVNNFRYSRFNLINAEVESPESAEFRDEQEARNSGFDFIKIYSLLTFLMFTLLLLSGLLFREIPYDNIDQNIFDSLIHTFSTLGTGGFSNYSASVGLPGGHILGGLANPVSEWIITIFMLISGANFGLWYILIYKRDWKKVLKNLELKIYIAIVSIIGGLITLILFLNNYYDTFEESARYAFFNVATVISTTGLADTDFTKWPVITIALLYILYFIGGTVGSTAGGLKVKRFIVLYKHLKHEIENYVANIHDYKTIKIDGVNYSRRDVSIVIITIIIYFFLFIGGSILFLIFDSHIDFTTSLNTSIATLGNIGPAAFVGTINDGPAGGYSEFGEISKIIMIFLMLFGRIGVMNIFYFLSYFTKERKEK